MTKLPSNSGTILVIDDEPTLCTLISRVLTKTGYRVVSFTNGQEALEMLQSQAEEIDCILMDLMMPKLSGEAVFTAIRALTSSVPIVLMSGCGNGKVISKRQNDQALSFLPKPFSINELRAAIEQTQLQVALQI